MQKNKLRLLMVSVLSALVLIVPGAAAAANNGNSNDDVTYCHATGSNSNPYVQVTSNKNGVVNGHANHQDNNDIIPPFSYNDHGSQKSYPGQNWNSQGQSIYNNGCKQPAGGMGGGGGTTNTTTTLQSQTAGSQVAAGGLGGGGAAGQVAVIPNGSVNAGGGGGSMRYNLASASGLGLSLASVIGGVVWLGRRRGLNIRL